MNDQISSCRVIAKVLELMSLVQRPDQPVNTQARDAGFGTLTILTCCTSHDFHFHLPFGQRCYTSAPTGPCHVNPNGWLRKGQNRHQAVQRTVPAAGMEFACGSHPAILEFQPNPSPDAPRVSGRSFQLDAQSRSTVLVFINPCGRAVLGHHQVNPAIAVEIRQGRTALFAIDANSRLVAWDRLETSRSIPPQPKSLARVQSAILGPHAKEILAQEDIFVSIAIGIGHAHGKGRCPLRLLRQ